MQFFSICHSVLCILSPLREKQLLESSKRVCFKPTGVFSFGQHLKAFFANIVSEVNKSLHSLYFSCILVNLHKVFTSNNSDCFRLLTILPKMTKGGRVYHINLITLFPRCCTIALFSYLVSGDFVCCHCFSYFRGKITVPLSQHVTAVPLDLCLVQESFQGGVYQWLQVCLYACLLWCCGTEHTPLSLHLLVRILSFH